MSFVKNYIFSSIGKKQIVALTGLGLILFVLFHLAGNLTVYLGAETYNAYAEKLQSLGAILWVLRIGLIAAFLVHIFFTILVVIENRKGRGVSYSQTKSVGNRSFATRTMTLSGILIFAFIIFHLKDFTFQEHHGPMSLVNGEDLGLFGLVINSFLSPIRASFYILAMVAVGSHISHAFESAFQSFGLAHWKFRPTVLLISKLGGLLVIILYSSIPIYAFLNFR